MEPCGCAGEHAVHAPVRARPLPMLCRMWKLWAGKQRRGGGPCIYIPERVSSRPDPCIYSQFMLMSLGQPVTWDNPDVALLRGGVEQNTYDLDVATDYDVVVTVHNSSRSKPALGTEVVLGWIEFGAGAEVRHPIGSRFVDVGVWPATATAGFSWTTPATPGHYCLEVDLVHVDDGNPSNNRGWNNTQVCQAQSEVRTPIRVFNRWIQGCPPSDEGRPALFELPLLVGFVLLGLAVGGAAAGMDTALRNVNHDVHFDVAKMARWALLGMAAGVLLGIARNLIAAWWRRRYIDAPDRVRQRERRERERIPCELVEIGVDSYEFEDGKGKAVDPRVMFAPKPSAWPARVEPASFRFDPGELFRDVLLIVDAPDAAGPPAPFNVSVHQGGAPSGGVTVLVERKG